MMVQVSSQSHSFTSESIREIQLNVLSWNIFMLPYLSFFNSNGERAKYIADTLKNSHYQIIVFQEAFSNKCRNIIAERIIHNYPYQYGPANKNFIPFKTNSGLWIVSKIPLKKLKEIRFNESQGFDSIANKGAVLFEGKFKNHKFQLLTTHLQADGLSDIRISQCLEIKKELLNPFFDKKIPQLICGDFNIDIDDRDNYHRMLDILDAQDGDTRDNFRVTYDEINNKLATLPNGKERTIDYVLVRNEDRIHKLEREVQTFLSKIGNKISHLSDHYAMEFNVYFRACDDNENLNLT